MARQLFSVIATYTIESNRTEAYDELFIERYILGVFCLRVYGVYYKKYKASPIDDDFEILAKRLISRLNEDESEDVGGSIEADAKACFERIPKERYDSQHHTSAHKGSLVFVGSDGLEYVFIAEESHDCDGIYSCIIILLLFYLQPVYTLRQPLTEKEPALS